ncbi:hypothetical protein I3843_14G047700 [Carya illinoinensis]|nr:hypothetical protein I3843_14G047700 [Carya illinoinensis]
MGKNDKATSASNREADQTSDPPLLNTLLVEIRKILNKLEAMEKDLKDLKEKAGLEDSKSSGGAGQPQLK